MKLKLRREIVPVNVDVRRFVRLVTEKVQAVWAAPQDRWH